MNQQIKLAFFDVDGTLASNEIDSQYTIDRVPQSAFTAIAKLKEKGIIPLLATGRTDHAVEDLLEALQIDSYIASNGAQVALNGEKIFEHFMDVSIIDEMIEHIVSQVDATITAETTTSYLALRHSNTYVNKLMPMHLFEDIHTKELANYDVLGINILTDSLSEDFSLPFKDLKTKQVGLEVYDVFPSHLSKASGIQKVLEQLNLSPEEIIVFGDEENDLEMFELAGTSVALLDANPKLKELATHITDSVDNDGLYKACVHFGLID